MLYKKMLKKLILINSPDIIVGGFRYQSFSLAGKREGLKDERGLLFFEFLRVFLVSGIFVDLKYKEKFDINEDYLLVDKLKAYTENIVLYDVLKLMQE